ncbi:ankyrin repeat-containing domain protein [Trichophaea hybrida]|nr:ankyrin repeat-containing domain protein [Trichophaea hybrida]
MRRLQHHSSITTQSLYEYGSRRFGKKDRSTPGRRQWPYRLVKQLLDRGAHIIEAADRNKRTALHLATDKGNESTVRQLLDRGANFEAHDYEECTVLHLAADKGHEATVRFLLHGYNAILDAQNIYKWTALHLAAFRGHQGTVELLLDSGAVGEDLISLSIPSNYGRNLCLYTQEKLRFRGETIANIYYKSTSGYASGE